MPARNVPNRNRRGTARIRRYADVLRALDRTSGSVRVAAIRAAKKELVLALVAVAKGIINRSIPLTKSQLNVIGQRSNDIRELVKPNATLSTQRRILQKGGFLSMILGPLLKGVIGPILGGVLGGRR